MTEVRTAARSLLLLFCAIGAMQCAAQLALGADTASSVPSPTEQRTLTDRTVTWPTARQWQRALLLEDYNTRVVALGTTLLGLAAGLVGSFTLLRGRTLMGDALSHATLPGIGLAFMLVTLVSGNGKSMTVLLFGAAASGLLGVGCILGIRNLTRLKEDAALGIVLSVFFGAGVAVLGVVQQMQTGHSAGLESFIYGKTASLIARDAELIAAAGLLCLAVTGLLFKELKLLCFDEGYAASRGLPVVVLDTLLMAVVVVVTIVGLQAVGLILMIALLVIPAAAARFWTYELRWMTMIAAGIGGVSSLVGSVASSIFPRLPSGAVIVLVATVLFGLSLLFGPTRGAVVRWSRRVRLSRKIDRQHLLRSLFEYHEVHSPEVFHSKEAARSIPWDRAVPLERLLTMRSWSLERLGRQIARAAREGLVQQSDKGAVRLTATGLAEANRLVRQHRLWELYLINYADIAPSKVDRDADTIEHVLEPAMIAELETLLARDDAKRGLPQSPHEIVVSSQDDATVQHSTPEQGG